MKADEESESPLNPLLNQSPLLQVLRRDVSGKMSVHDCLRSKVNPHLEVKRVLENPQHLVGPENLLLQNTLVLQTLAVMKKLALDDNHSISTGEVAHRGPVVSSGRCDRGSSLWYISNVSISIHYLQLLLELNYDNADSSIVQVLRALTGFACSVLERPTNIDATTERPVNNEAILTEDAACQFKAVHLACYIFESLVRFNNGYVRTRPSLLSPLWKSLCDIAVTKLPNQNGSWLPSTLTHNAVTALLDYLNEGVSCALQLVSTDPRTHEEQLLFQSKVLGFLQSRLGTIWSAGDKSSSSFLKPCLSTLSRLRGLCLLLVERTTIDDANPLSNDALRKAYAQLAGKAEKCFWNRLARADRDSDASVLDDNVVQTLLLIPLRERTSANADGQAEISLPNKCLALGMIALVLCSFDHIINCGYECLLLQSDVEAVLKLTQLQVFKCIPYTLEFHRKAPMLLLARFMTITGTLLLWCEVGAPCIATNVDPGRARFHRLLLSWLTVRPETKPCLGEPCGSPSLHPLSLELALSLWHLHVLGLCRWSPTHDPTAESSAMPLVSLSVELAFHADTETTFRSHLACFLVRLLNSGNACDRKAGDVHDIVGSMTRSLIRSRMKRLERLLKPSKKRKREEVSCSKQLPAPSDLRIVIWMASHISAPETGPSIQSILHLLNGAPQATRLGLSALQLARTAFPAEPTVMELFSQWFGRSVRKVISRYKHHTTLCGEAALESIREHSETALASQGSSPGTITQILCHVLEDEQCWQESSFSWLMFAAIQSMASIGRLIAPPASDDSLNSIIQLFQRLLSFDDWTVRSYSMCSMISFASSVPVSHRNILKPCVPESRRKIFSSRLQNSLLTSDEERSTGWAYCYKRLALSLLNHTKASNARLLPEARSSNIAPGSYFMTMPTQGGRNALVIFPPCEASLVDIRYMLGLEGDSQPPPVLVVQRSVALEDGTCKLFLEKI